MPAGDPRDPVARSSRPTAGPGRLDEVAARKAAGALHSLARDLGLRSSSVEVPSGDPLARFAAAAEFGEFNAAYLAFGLGLDPGSRSPAERAH